MATGKSNAPAKTGTAPTEISQAEDISSFLEQVKRMPPAERGAGGRGRLIFAMDATMSRQPSWDRALQIQSEMFIETEKIGGLDVQLVYFRGFNECRASKWASEPSTLAQLMTGVDCRGGNTQIGKVLSHIRRAASENKISAAVYVGDAMEENVDRLCQTAGEIGLLNVPIFMFQEGRDGVTEQAFREIAKLTRGAYFRLDASSARQLRELLAAVAVYAAGGRQALADHSREKGGTARLLLEQLR
ncbi:VWA domain-containing protein [Taklimakanibacter albus]|uniref:VWA domain-containing protein n=1 Tax=Taklimakanibacter albus TaxID=2800327 RepID=A0ACC5R236_9HYPH|nr:VWA domain-containing protein [Aestuariivirga sp. YIM B02566]MBK1866719.1 VWA domain-containing protein [Aestuariivirga sp. YIM B02566]